MTVPAKKAQWIYSMMVKARYFEETMVDVYNEGKTPVFNIGAGTVPGEMHLAAGQEPSAVIMAHLDDTDTVVSTHRPHHHAIAKGVNLNELAAEIFGKKTGLGKGKGGHMHLFDPRVKFSCGGIVAAGIPQAAGAALAAKMNGTDRVAVAFIGEGAANAGAFHESLNLASLWDLGLIVVVEDNQWGISVHKDTATSIENNADRAAAYGIKGYKVKDNNPFEMYRVSEKAVSRARRGEGPSIIETETYRYLGHFQGDPELYRDENEVPELKKNDPIEWVRKQLIDEKLITGEELNKLTEDAHAEVDEAFQFARDSEYPAPDDAFKDLFV